MLIWAISASETLMTFGAQFPAAIQKITFGQERDSGHAAASCKIELLFRGLRASRRVLCLSKCFERVTDEIMALMERNVSMFPRAVMVVGCVAHFLKSVPMNIFYPTPYA